MRLAIADPPYLGRANIWYGDGMSKSQRSKRDGGRSNCGTRPADNNPNAKDWDDPIRHEEMVYQLIDNYDGWVIAMAHDNLRDYLTFIPRTVPIRVAIWTKTQPMPSGARIMNIYEPCVVRIPDGRRDSEGAGQCIADSVRISRLNNGFAGAKPPAWTRWCLDMLGFDPETDTVDDLFPGSGAVQREINQGVLV